jgi:glucokinase
MKEDNKAPYALGIDIGGTSLKGVVLSKSGKASLVTVVPTEAQKGGKKVMDNVLALISALIKMQQPAIKFLGVGIGTPGSIDNKGTVFGGAHNLPGWEGMQVFKPIVKQFGLSPVSCNDATAMTLAEWRYGAAKGFSNVVCLSLGTGIGGGMIIDNKLYAGAHGLAGEFGHVSVDYQGVSCKCGQRGCVERYASATGIVQTALDLCAGLAKKDKTPFSRLAAKAPQSLTSKIIFDYIKQNDPIAQRVGQLVCDKLARIIGVIVNSLAPERIVLGGGVMNAAEAIIALTRQNVPRYCLAASLKNCTLVPARLGDQAGVIGAAQMVFEETVGKRND